MTFAKTPQNQKRAASRRERPAMTPRQAAVFDFYCRRRTAGMPTPRAVDVAAHLGIQNASEHIGALIEAGYLVRDGRTRPCLPRRGLLRREDVIRILEEAVRHREGDADYEIAVRSLHEVIKRVWQMEAV